MNVVTVYDLTSLSNDQCINNKQGGEHYLLFGHWGHLKTMTVTAAVFLLFIVFDIFYIFNFQNVRAPLTYGAYFQCSASMNAEFLLYLHAIAVLEMCPFCLVIGLFGTQVSADSQIFRSVNYQIVISCPFYFAFVVQL